MPPEHVDAKWYDRQALVDQVEQQLIEFGWGTVLAGSQGESVTRLLKEFDPLICLFRKVRYDAMPPVYAGSVALLLARSIQAGTRSGVIDDTVATKILRSDDELDDQPRG